MRVGREKNGGQKHASCFDVAGKTMRRFEQGGAALWCELSMFFLVALWRCKSMAGLLEKMS